MAHDSSEYPTAERRQYRRRADDVKEHQIAAEVDAELPILAQILKAGKVAGALFALGTLIGSSSAFISLRVLRGDELAQERRDRMAADTMLRRSIDSNYVRITGVQSGQQEIIVQLQHVVNELELQSYAQCIVIRRVAPDVRPKGCDAVERRGGTQP